MTPRRQREGDVSHADQKKLGDISAVVDGQKGRLTRIGGAITKLAASAADLGGANPKSDDAAPLREILDLLAVAAGTSHIAAASEPKLVEAMQLQATLSVRALQATERGMIGATKTVHQQAGDNVTTGNRSREAVGLQEESRKLQSKILDGQDVDPEEMEDVSVRSQATTLKSRTYGTIHALDDIRQAATVVDKGDAAIIASMFSGEFRDLPSACKKLIEELHPILGNLNAQFNDAEAELKRGAGSEARKKDVRESRRKAVTDAQDKFKDLQQRHDLAKFFKNANEKLKNQQLRAAIVRAAALIGLSLVAGAVAEFAAGGMASMLMDAGGASNVAELGLAARTTVSITRSAVDSAVNAVGMTDKDHGFVEAWEQNMIMTLASNAVFGSMTGYAETAAKEARVEEQLLQTWAQKQVAKAGKLGKSLGKAGEVIKGAATISAHTIWGAAIAEVAGRIVTGKSQPSAQTMQDWAIQGASVFLGRQIAHHIGANKKLYKEIDETIGKTNHMLAMKAEKLQALADSVAGSKDPTKALELLNEHEKFMRDELDSLEKAIEKGDPTGDLELHRAATEAALKDMGSASTLSSKFKLLGLDELIPGALWRGTRPHIDSAINQAKADHPNTKVRAPGAHTKRWTLESEVGEIEIEEIVQGQENQADAKKPADAAKTETVETKTPSANDGPKPTHEGEKPVEAQQPREEKPAAKDAAPHEPLTCERVVKEHPEAATLTTLPPETMIGSHVQERALARVASMSPQEYAEFGTLLNGLTEPVAKGFLYKAAAAGNSMADLHWLAGQMAGKKAGWLVDNLTLGDPRGVGGGLKQQWAHSCNAAVTLTIHGNYDPVFSLRLREANHHFGEVNEHDPKSLNTTQAELEQQMLESEYGGGHFESQSKHKGKATPRANAHIDGAGTGRFADDLLNQQSHVTGASYVSLPYPSGQQVVNVLEHALTQNIQVPLIIGDIIKQPQAHYILVQERRAVGAHVEYNVLDPWTGESQWIAATAFEHSKLPFPGANRVGTIEVPTAIPTTAAAGHQAGARGAEHGHSGPAHKEVAKSEIEPTLPGGDARTRITTQTPHLYESVKPEQKPPGFDIEHVDRADVEAKLKRGEKVRLTTKISTVNDRGELVEGSMTRSYDPKTKTLEMVSAFFKEGMPRKVPHDHALDPANPSDGVPLFAFVQIQQLKIFGIHDGELRHLKMSSVVNVVTAVELHLLAQSRGLTDIRPQRRYRSVSFARVCRDAASPVRTSGRQVIDPWWHDGVQDRILDR